jgi:tetratricopeptide (TPR) repeat protein
MEKIFIKIALILTLTLGYPLAAICQSEKDGITIYQDGRNLEKKASSKADLEKALKKYEEALAVFEKAGSAKKTYALNQIGVVYNLLGQYTKALEYFEKSLLIKKKGDDVKVEGLTLNNIGSVYKTLGQYDRALEYFERSLQVKRKIGDVKNEADTINTIGEVYRSLGQYTKALEYCEKSLQMSKKIRDRGGEAGSLGNIGNVYLELGQYSKAIDYYDQCLKIEKKLGDVRGEAGTHNNLGKVYSHLGQYTVAIESYEEALQREKKFGDVKGEGDTLNNIGIVYSELGQYTKALEYYERSLAIRKKIGDVSGEGYNLNNIGLVYKSLGQYTKALEYYEQSLEIEKKIGDAKAEGYILNNIGEVYASLGQYTKSLEYYEQSLQIKKKIGDIYGEGATLGNMGQQYAQTGKSADALTAMKRALQISEILGTPTTGRKNAMANLYLDMGDFTQAEILIKETGDNSSLGRLALLGSDYPLAVNFYETAVSRGEKTGNADALFTNYTGLATAYEGIKDYPKAEEYYEKAMKLTEEIRSGLLPSERKNFFEVKTGGFARSDPAKGLARVRMKLNRPEASIIPTELTKARSFSDHLSNKNSIGATDVPSSLMEKEQSYVNQLAAVKKNLIQTDPEKFPDKFKNLSKSAQEGNDELNAFIDKLWKDYPAYAAVKYPRPPSLKDSALRPDECAVMFDVSGEGVGVILIRDKAVNKAFYLDLKLADLERDATQFREPFEKLRLKDYDPELAKSLYDKLLRPALADIPKGAPLTIIPDGILAMLPFEALVTGGEVTWSKSADGLDYPEGLTFLGDEHPISYYQSITALTLVRTIGNKDKPKDGVLVVADPVFNMKDQRAQKASETRLSEREKEYNIQRMAAMEETTGPIFPQLPETAKLANNLAEMYGANCLSITGLKADKQDFLSKIAPQVRQYGKVIFATHGVMGNKVPGVMEPFLALTMVPPGTDGFLKMSDILSLNMNADVVALTACQSGLGKELSGEGVMSMGRAFQYAGSKSVMMSLWSVAESSSVKLTESFFQHRKSSKSKLDSLKAAREDIRNAGYKHPFFWAAFILVGETN